MKVKEIAFTSYPVANVAKLRDRYRDILGLHFNSPYEDNGVLKYDHSDAHREFKGKGVKVGEIIETPGCRMFSVYDLEGNRFGVHQITVPH
jgi:hypothetical protein